MPGLNERRTVVAGRAVGKGGRERHKAKWLIDARRHRLQHRGKRNAHRFIQHGFERNGILLLRRSCWRGDRANIQIDAGDRLRHLQSALRSLGERPLNKIIERECVDPKEKQVEPRQDEGDLHSGGATVFLRRSSFQPGGHAFFSNPLCSNPRCSLISSSLRRLRLVNRERALPR